MKCLIVDDDPMARAMLEHFVDQHAATVFAGSCGSASEAANVLRSTKVDVLFLDIEMPEMTGIELVRNLKSVPEVVLVTSRKEYAVEAFEIEVADYLLKPVAYSRFMRTIERLNARIAPTDSAMAEDHVFIKTNGRLVNLDLRTVQWIEAQGDYVQVVAETDRYMVHGTMKKIESKLPERDFIRVHRSFIVRIDRVKDVEDTTLVVGAKVIPIGASYRGKFHQRINTL